MKSIREARLWVTLFLMGSVLCGTASALTQTQEIPETTEGIEFAFTRFDRMPQRLRETAVVADGEAIYVVGGHSKGAATSAVWLYEPANKKWTSLPAMAEKRYGHGVAIIKGRLYAYGGMTGAVASPEFLQSVESLDLKDRVWKKETSLAFPRARFGTTAFNDKIYLVGGHTRDNSAVNTVEVFDPATQQWTRKNDLPEARKGPALVHLNENLYLVGGESVGGQAFKNSLVYDLSHDSWHPSGRLATGRKGFDAVAYHNEILVTGGRHGASRHRYLSQVDLLNPLKVEGLGTKLGSLSVPRVDAASVTTGDSVYVFGGFDGEDSNLVEQGKFYLTPWSRDPPD